MRKLVSLMVLLILGVPSISSFVSAAEGLVGPTEYLDLPRDNEMAVFDEIVEIEPGTQGRTGGRSVTIPPIQTQQAIGHITDTVSINYINSYLTTLVGFGSRLYRAPGMENATLWLHDILDGNGRLEASYHNFTVVRPTWGTFVLSNVILTLPGLNTSSDRIYYMYAHSDAVQMTDSNQWLTNTPGADDDGSGCAATLEAARILSRFEFQDTIKFAFFQAEEIGLYGSGYYAQNMSAWGENVWGGIDYDMVGYSSGTTQYDFDLYYNPASAWQGQHMVDVNDRYDIGLNILEILTTSSIPSDIWRFYQNGFPSVMGIEEDFNPYYHTLQDTVDKINMTLMTKSTKLAVASLSEMARLIYVDLGIPSDGLIVSNDSPVSDENVTITANIENTGNLNATDVEVEFYVDGFPITSKRINVLADGSNETSAYWTAEEGSHNIQVFIDPKNEIVESDETNNTASKIVDVNDRPKAVLTATPMTVLTNETLWLNGTLSSDEVGGVSEYDFFFGDGSESGWTSSPVVTHSYPEDGQYVTSLKVKDAGDAESYMVNLTVSVLNRAPSASPSSNLTRTLTLVPIQFTSEAHDPDGSVFTHWTFGDGGESDEIDPVHQYAKTGTYTVGLNITDDDGASASYELGVIVDNRLPTCWINASSIFGNITTEFSLTALAQDFDGSVEVYEWDLGDGSFASTLQVVHLYDKPGNYTVRLTVKDDDGSQAHSMEILSVIDLPPVAIATSTPTTLKTFENVYFTGEGSYDLEGLVTYQWDFDDGNISFLVSPVHSYTKPGIYTPTLTVRDVAGQFDTVVLGLINVLNRPPVGDFWFFGDLETNGSVYFDATNSSDLEGPIILIWDFGDNSSGNGLLISHIFLSPGNYSVTLAVEDENGERDIVVHIVQIKEVVVIPVDEEPDSNTTEKDPIIITEDSASYESLLIFLNILWMVVLALVLLWFLKIRTKKRDDPQMDEQTSLEMEGPPQAVMYTPMDPQGSPDIPMATEVEQTDFIPPSHQLPPENVQDYPRYQDYPRK